jgi:hypothetical protein
MRHYKLFSILFKEKSQLATTLTTHLPLWEFFCLSKHGFFTSEHPLKLFLCHYFSG